MRLRYFMKKIIEKIKNWWKGSEAEYDQDRVTGHLTLTKPAYRHWLARLIDFIVGAPTATWKAILKNPNVFITQLFAFAAIVLAAASLYLQFYKDDDEYKRCTVTNTDQHFFTMKCEK